MQQPLLVTTDESSQLPLLIVDKKGVIGNALATKLREQFLIVVVTASEVAIHDNLIHIPYKRKIPLIPDNTYSHIFVIYNGEQEILDMLPSFVKKAQQSRARLFFVASLADSTKKLFFSLQKPLYQDMQLIYYGEPFSEGSTEVNGTNFFIHQVRSYQRIEVPNAGLGRLYPIFFDDIITMIVSVAFGDEKRHRLLYGFSQYETTEISVARILQKLDPLIKIDFKKRPTRERDYYIPPGGVAFYKEYDLESRLRLIDRSPTKETKIIPQKKLRFHVPDPEARRRRVLLIGAFLSAVYIAPIVLTILLAVSGAGFLSLSLSQAEKGRLGAAQQLAMVSQSSFAATESLIPSLYLLQFSMPDQTEQFAEKIQMGNEVVATELDGIHALQLLQNIYDKKSLDPKNDFLRALATLKNTLLTFQTMKAEHKLPKVVEDKLEKFNGVSDLVEGTIDTWPALFGFEGKKQYLVLFQNNMELRPGGGFIGSYGLLPVENGHMAKLRVFDVYDADGKLKNHVEPPYGLRRYMGAAHWFLRDSNYDVDFTRDAVQAAQFLTLETGDRVDGVIAIDTTFLKNLLTVLGSVDVPDYNERVTPDNFYLMTQNHAEKGFFPGSTQKKDFLRSLTNAMMVRLLEKKDFSYEKLIQAAEVSIREKHLLFAFSDQGVQNVFTVNGLSSSLQDGRPNEKNAFLDYFGVIDANVGGNKANYYVKRSINQDLAVDGAGGLQATAEVTYTNTSAKDSVFGGDYKNYVRFLLPLNAEVQGVAFDNQDLGIGPAITDPGVFTEPGFVPPANLEVEQTVEIGKKVVGIFVQVPTGSTKKVKLTYFVPSAVNLKDSSFSYNMRLFKQPGAANDPYTLFLSYPLGFKPVRNDQNAANLGGKLVYETLLDQDKDFNVTFSKK